MLKFSEANAKTKRLAQIPDLKVYLRNGKRKVYSLDLPAGYSCPGARDCLSKCVGGKIQDGKHTQFRCFSASQEVCYPNVHKMRSHNFQQVLNCNDSYDDIYSLLADSMPKDAGIVRYHVSGDFFSLNYLRAALMHAWFRPDVLFYGYTKSIHLVNKIEVNNLAKGKVLTNFLLTASLGGKYDDQIGNMRTARVIFDEANANGLPIDHDDSHAATVGGSFCLLIHGTQPKGSAASSAWQKIKAAKKGYSR